RPRHEQASAVLVPGVGIADVEVTILEAYLPDVVVILHVRVTDAVLHLQPEGAAREKLDLLGGSHRGAPDAGEFDVAARVNDRLLVGGDEDLLGRREGRVIFARDLGGRPAVEDGEVLRALDVARLAESTALEPAHDAGAPTGFHLEGVETPVELRDRSKRAVVA